jgi:hypothetical protein
MKLRMSAFHRKLFDLAIEMNQIENAIGAECFNNTEWRTACTQVMALAKYIREFIETPLQEFDATGFKLVHRGGHHDVYCDGENHVRTTGGFCWQNAKRYIKGKFRCDCENYRCAARRLNEAAKRIG